VIAIARCIPSYFADWATWWRHRPRWLARHRATQQIAWEGVMTATFVANPKTVAVLCDGNALLDKVLQRLEASREGGKRPLPGSIDEALASAKDYISLPTSDVPANGTRVRISQACQIERFRGLAGAVRNSFETWDGVKYVYVRLDPPDDNRVINVFAETAIPEPLSEADYAAAHAELVQPMQDNPALDDQVAAAFARWAAQDERMDAYPHPVLDNPARSGDDGEEHY
jgi:hypothetical protein